MTFKMAYSKLLPAIAMCLAATFAACDDSTSIIGSDIMPDNDNVSTSQQTFIVHSQTVKADSVLANTNDCYLGKIIDPETRAYTTCGYLAQFHVMENYSFPKLPLMMQDDSGKAVADSCALRIFFSSYFGDSLTNMKLRVTELDTANVIEEGEDFYTDINASKYVSPNPTIRQEVTYAINDLTRPDTATSSSNYKSIVVRLPREYGSYLINKYYENPSFYQNSYQFIRHVCPGFMFENSGGVGAMVHAEITALDVYFRYHSKTAAGKDTIVDGMQRMAATEEVIQSAKVSNDIPSSMLNPDNGYTYAKSPAALFTEVELPVADIVAGQHYSDTINTASMVLRQHSASVSSGSLQLNAPTSLLMVRKADAKKFFLDEKLPNSVNSFLATYNTDTRSYNFSNISQLVTLIKNERDSLAGVSNGDDEATRLKKYQIWEASASYAPDWNKVMIIPVKATYSTTTSGYQQVTSLVKLRHEMGLSSVKLSGGTSPDLKLNVIYSRFDK